MSILEKIDETKPSLAEQLVEFAYKSSCPFCYGCYVNAVGTEDGLRCPKCHSDDLAKLVDGVGVDFGTDWIIDHFVSQNVPVVDFENYFEEYISECYGDTCQIGWLNIDTAHVIKYIDPISWDMAKSELADSLIEDGELIEADDGKYYWINDIETYLL